MLDGGGAGGIPEIPGEPDGLRAGAAGLAAAGSQLNALAGEVARSTSGVPWTGIAALAARVATVAAAAPLRDADEHLSQAAGALRRYASELEAAQQETERARAQLADALAAAGSAASALGSLVVEEDADPAAVARAGDRLDAANADASAARTAGAQAFDRAEQAARTAAHVFSAVAAAAPEPPPPPAPPPPPKEDEGGGFLDGALGFGKDVVTGAAGGVADGANWLGGAASDGWEWAGNQGSPWNPHSPAFAVDVIEGAAGAVWGVGELGWQGVKASTYYERFDPEGAEEARQGFADGAEYAWENPWETAKVVLGINHFENGEPGKFAGEAGITALATLASGGAAAGLKGASGASKVSKLDDVVDISRAAGKADDVSDLQKLGRFDYSDRMAREVPNFADPKPVPHTGTKPNDELLVNLGDSSRAVGSERSLGWWMPLDEARTRTSVEEFRNAYALPEQWREGGSFQAKDEVLIARIPAGTETTRLDGIAAPQRTVPDPRPGGGRQIFFREFDAGWIEARMSTEDFLSATGRRP